MFAPWLLALLVALVAAQIVAPVGNPGLAPSNNGSEPLRLFIDSPRGIVDLGPIEALTAQASLDSPDAIKVGFTSNEGWFSADSLDYRPTGTDESPRRRLGGRPHQLRHCSRQL